VRAFEVHAVDYLVKPFDAKRLAIALGRARERLAARRAARPAARGAGAGVGPGTLTPELAALLAAVQPAPAADYVTRLAVRVGERVYWVRTADIDWVEADGNYLRLHTGSGTPQAKAHLIRKPLAALAEELDPSQFARIHRSTLVNIDRIRELRALSDGEYQVFLTDGTKLKLSRTYRQNLPAF
jgi:two-component system LytT family response regulator